MGAHTALAAEGIAVRVVSMPCTSVFDRQDAVVSGERAAAGRAARRGRSGRHRRLAQVRRAVERRGVVGIDTFGESAPAGALFKYFGFTAENVVAAVKRVLA